MGNTVMKRRYLLGWLVVAGCTQFPAAPTDAAAGDGPTDIGTDNGVDVGLADASPVDSTSIADSGIDVPASEVAVMDATTPPADVPADTTAGSADVAPVDAPDASTVDTPDAPAVDAPVVVDAASLAAPRPIAPLSGSITTRQNPTFRWRLPDGADGVRLEICPTRACDSGIRSFDLAGSEGAPPEPLAPGLHFWRIRPRAGPLTGTAASPTWQVVIPRRSAPTDTSWAAPPDFNNDGLADLAVGSVTVSPGAYVYSGGPLPLTGTPTGIARPSGAAALSNYFGSVAAAGDVNGDGYSDLAVGATGYASSRGRVFLYLGGAGHVATEPALFLDADLAAADSNFGTALSLRSAGDINGDGFGDLAIGASGYNGRVGRVLVYLGREGGLATTPITLDGPDGAGGRFGESVASGWDVDRDGYADLVVGAPGALSGQGRIYLYRGSAMGFQTGSPLSSIDGPSGAMGFGRVTGLDADGNGYGDVAVAAPQTASEQGRVYLYLGGPSGLMASTAAEFSGVGASFGFGAWIAGAGDVNGDGRSDLLVSEPNGTTEPEKRAFLFYGSSAGLNPSRVELTRPSPVLPAVSAWARCAVGAGDLNGDGFDDIAVGADGAGVNPGQVFIFPGSSSGPQVSSPPRIDSPSRDAMGQFGYPLAWRRAGRGMLLFASMALQRGSNS